MNTNTIKYTPYDTIRKWGRDTVSRLAEEHKVFYAFSNKQFDEGMAKIGVTDSKDIVDIGYGGFCPRDMARSYIEGLNWMGTEEKCMVLGLCDHDEVIMYELNNHESFYTGCIDSAVDALAPYEFPRDKIYSVYRDNAQAWWEEYG